MNRRIFTLEAYDLLMNKLSTFILEKVTSVSGIGFKQKVTIQETDTVDYVIHHSMEKKANKLQVHFWGSDCYSQARAFLDWIASYVDLSSYKMVLKYNEGTSDKWIDTYIQEYELIGMEAGVASVQLTIKPLSPPYTSLTKTILITSSKDSKTYPYGYPYAYGGGSYGSNDLVNSYIHAIPLCVTLYGKIANPQVSLFDEAGNCYATVKFTGVTLQAGHKIIVDGINYKITYVNADGEELDYFNYIDKTSDTFLFAKKGTSKIVPNLDSSEESSPYVEITYIQYSL